MAETERKLKRRPSLTFLIVAGLVAGFAWGMFFGERGEWVKWIGDAFVGLLQMTVLPFVALSLTSNVGRLSAKQGGRLARVATSVLLLLWVIGLLTMVVMSASFPKFEAGSFFSTSLVEEPERPDWLALFIPSNPFWSLAHNLVPAVVLFSLGLGVAVMSVPNKELLLDKLDVAIQGLARLNRMVVRLSPVGIFGIVGHAAGTMSLQQFGLVQGYLLVYGAAALLLSLWILPAVIASCTPFSHRDVLSASRDTLITAFVIGNTFVVLPLIIDAVKRLAERREPHANTSDQTPEYFVPLAYPFPDIGRIVGLIFIPFAAWFYGMSIDPGQYPQLIGVGFIGAFAKPVVTMPLLLNVAEIPSDIFNLYLSVGVVAARFGDVMKAMHLLTFSILTACALSGVLRVRVRGLLTRGVATVLLVAVTVLGMRGFLGTSFKDEYSKQNLVTARTLLLPPVEASVLEQASPNPMSLEPDEDPIQRIRRRGVIRIGFEVDELPFAYLNQEGDLVGFDIDMAHQLARDLGVRIEFVPSSSDVVQSLRDDEFDVAMSGFEGTVRRATELPHVPSYMDVTMALIVPD